MILFRSDTYASPRSSNNAFRYNNFLTNKVVDKGYEGVPTANVCHQQQIKRNCSFFFCNQLTFIYLVNLFL